MKRSRDWNEGLAKDLRDQEFAREFIAALLDEGFTLQAALAKTVRAYGVSEFADRAHIAGSNLVRSIRADANPTQRTLEQILKPLGLRLSVAPRLRRRRRSSAA
jgi:DNA-binding phage protein